MKNISYLNFPVVITQDGDGYMAYSPAIPGCHSEGETYEAVQKNIQEAIELCLEVAKEDVHYRKKIDFGSIDKPQMISVTNISILRPSYL